MDQMQSARFDALSADQRAQGRADKHLHPELAEMP